jgi:UDP-N-acetylmuramoylalanine--D-glutamate ligase
VSASFPARLVGRRATVMGLGLFGGGACAARWLVEQGARVTVTDLRDAEVLAPTLVGLEDLDLELVLGRHRAQDFEHADLVVANPAVPPDAPWLQRARAAGARVTSEVELFLRTTRARVVLVTGTQGKSSTTSLLAQLLTASGIRACAGGNIGAPLLGAQLGPEEVAVVELSSYQLEALPTPCPAPTQVEVALVTGVLADHLERHGTAQAYAEAKARVLELVPARGSAWLPIELAGRTPFDRAACPVRTFGPGAELTLGDGRFRLEDEDLGAVSDLALPGEFQQHNALLALGAARILGADAQELAAAIGGLRGLPHRLEDLGLVDGRRVLDNGVSTTPDSTLAALEDVSGPCTLLIGGQDKRGLPFTGLANRAAEKDTQVIAFGAAAEDLVERFRAAGSSARAVDTVETAATEGLAATPPGGTLLFSPACASFDAHNNFRARALAFRAALDLPSQA